MDQRNSKKYYYLYKITNLINGKYYYGMHSTNDLNDNYMGSGKILNEAIAKYGIENFKKDIIQYCSTFDELSDLEKSIVTKNLINDPNCYNLIEGGYYISEEQLAKIGQFNSINQKGEKNSAYGKVWMTNGTESVMINKSLQVEYEKNGWKKGRTINNRKISDKVKGRIWVHKGDDTHQIQKDELEKYLNDGYSRGRTECKPKRKEVFEGSMKGKVSVRDRNGNKLTVSVSDPRYLNGTLVAYNKGKTLVQDKEGNRLMVFTNDERILTGELVKVNYNAKSMSGKVAAKDKEGNVIIVDKLDSRLLSGELVGVNKGKHWKQRK